MFSGFFDYEIAMLIKTRVIGNNEQKSVTNKQKMGKTEKKRIKICENRTNTKIINLIQIKFFLTNFEQIKFSYLIRQRNLVKMNNVLDKIHRR
jgi:hypothetical protein